VTIPGRGRQDLGGWRPGVAPAISQFAHTSEANVMDQAIRKPLITTQASGNHYLTPKYTTRLSGMFTTGS